MIWSYHSSSVVQSIFFILQVLAKCFPLAVAFKQCISADVLMLQMMQLLL